MNLSVNMLIEWVEYTPSLKERVLWIDPLGADLVTIDINLKNTKALPLWRKREEIETGYALGNVRILDADPFDHLLLPEHTIPEEYRKRRDAAWESIETLVTNKTGEIFDARKRGALISDLVETTGRRKGTFYERLRRFWQGGQTKNALLPYFFNCGGRGQMREEYESKPGRPGPLSRAKQEPTGCVIDATKREYLRRGIKTFYLSGKEQTLKGAYHRTLETYFANYDLRGNVLVPILPPAEELPTIRQFTHQYYTYLRDPAQLSVAREGERRFNLRYRMLLGDSTQMAFGPGSLAQIDATIGDIYLVSKRDRSRIIGRPIIYIIIDVFTRMIMGISVSLEGPSWRGMMLSLENTFTKKTDFCREYGIEITEDEWPCHHLPEALLGDRGELEGYNADNLINNLDIRVHNTAPYRCDWKGIVEQHFRLINDQIIHWMPGAVYHPRERGEKDYRLDARLDLDQFRRLMILCVLRHNNHHRMKWYKLDEFAIADHVERYPIDLWQWGICNRSGHLRTKDAKVVRLNLLPRAEASVTERGISFKKALYTCSRAISEQWFVKARLHGRWKIPIIYDPRKTDNIYLSPSLEPCKLLDQEKSLYQGRDWQEVEDFLELEKQAEEASRTRLLRAEAEFHAQAEHTIQEAEEMTKEAIQGMSKSARLRNIREHRKNERDEEHQRQTGQAVLEAALEVQKETSSTSPEDVGQTNGSGYIPGDQPIDEVRRRRKEKLRQSQEEHTHG